MTTPSDPTVDHKDPSADSYKLFLQDLVKFLGEARPVSQIHTDKRISWSDIVENAVKIIPVLGILMYGTLSLAYNRFYGPLSVKPSDVGLGYLDTLANSVEAVLTFLLLLILCGAGLFMGTSLVLFLINVPLAIREVRKMMSSRPASIHDETGAIEVAIAIISVVAIVLATVNTLIDRLRNTSKLTLRLTLWGLAVISIILVTYALPHIATEKGADAAAGTFVTPPRLPALRLSLLEIHADPAEIQAIGEKGKTPAIDRLVARPPNWPSLLYLGRTTGIVVLYDSQLKQSIYVSASSILLRVNNCESKPRPAACRDK